VQKIELLRERRCSVQRQPGAAGARVDDPAVEQGPSPVQDDLSVPKKALALRKSAVCRLNHTVHETVAFPWKDALHASELKMCCPDENHFLD
jgi:hypothetical protein